MQRSAVLLPQRPVAGARVYAHANSITATSWASASADWGAGTSRAIIAAVHAPPVALCMMSARRTARSMSVALAVMEISTTPWRLSSALMIKSASHRSAVWSLLMEPSGRGGGMAHRRRSTEEHAVSCCVSLAQDHYPDVALPGELCGRVQSTCSYYC